MRSAVLHFFLKRTTSALGGAVALVLPLPPCPPPPKKHPDCWEVRAEGRQKGLGCQQGHPCTGLWQHPAAPSTPCPELGGLGTAQLDAAQGAPAAAIPLPLGLGTLLLLAAHHVGMARGRGTGQLPSNVYSHLHTRKVSEVQSKTEFRGVSGNSRAAYAKFITKIL